MGRSATDRLRDGGIAAKKGSVPQVPIGDVWIPPPGHPLWHPRGQDPIDEELCADIVEKCEITERLVVRDEGIVDGKRRLTLLDGARRTVNGREAEKRLRKLGVLKKCPENPKAELYVDVEFFKGDDSAFLLERLRRNADPLKKPDRPSVLAATFLQLAKLKTPIDSMLLVAPRQIGKREIEAMLDWPNLLPECAEQFDSGAAPVVFLRSVLDAPRAEQLACLAKLIASGVTSAAGATRTLRREASEAARGAGAPASPKMRSRAFVVALRDVVRRPPRRAGHDEVAVAVLSFLLGDDKALDAYPTLKQGAIDAGWSS